MSEEPKNCPFCGDDVGSNSFWFCTKPGPPARYNVFCLGCEFDGPGADTLDGAIAAWNRRSPPGRAEDGGGWRPIETAPRDADVLLYCPEIALSNPERIELGQAVMTHGQERGWSYHSWATHWRPLPPPPSQGPGALAHPETSGDGDKGGAA